MSTEQTHSRINVNDDAARAGVERGEPGGRAVRDAGAASCARGPWRRAAVAGVRDRLLDELIDEQLLAGARTEQEIVGPGGLLADLMRRLVERALSAELTEHLGYEPHEEPGGTGNARNGATPKTLATEHGPSGSTLPGIATPALSRRSCARTSAALKALTTRSSRSPAVACRSATSRRTCTRSTGEGRRRPDQPRHRRRHRRRQSAAAAAAAGRLPGRLPGLSGRKDPRRRDRAAPRLLLALGVNLDGDRDVLGMWFAETEGAKFWMQVLAEPKQRGIRDILICCVDGLPAQGA
jgi:putative transposase